MAGRPPTRDFWENMAWREVLAPRPDAPRPTGWAAEATEVVVKKIADALERAYDLACEDAAEYWRKH